MTIAGLWSEWTNPETDKPQNTCTMIVTESHRHRLRFQYQFETRTPPYTPNPGRKKPYGTWYWALNKLSALANTVRCLSTS